MLSGMVCTAGISDATAAAAAAATVTNAACQHYGF
jgi:hypothetical protein